MTVRYPAADVLEQVAPLRSGGTGPDPAHSYPDHGHPDHGHPDHGDNGLAAVSGPAGADSPAARADDLVVEDDPRYDDDEAEHAAWLSGIRASGDADDDDDEYCPGGDDDDEYDDEDY